MGKRILSLALLYILLPLAMMADSYHSLWKQFTEARNKDLPKTELNILRQISFKSEADNNYGQLLSAELMTASLKSSISPDSLSAGIERLKTKAREAESSDLVLAAIYESALGRFYAENPSLGTDYILQSQKYYALSMSHPDLLAKQQASEYNPLFTKGIDSDIFSNDLLHVIGLQAQDYKALLDYYQKAGNRPASCVMAWKLMNASQKVDVLNAGKSKYLQHIDSLIHVYEDIPAAGELALARYQFMQRAKDVTVADRILYIDYALSQWGSWPGMSFLRNERKSLTNPFFSVSIGREVMIPNRPFVVKIDQIRHLPNLLMTIQHVKMDADQLASLTGSYGLTTINSREYKKLEKHLSSAHQITDKKQYGVYPPYKIIRDSFEVKGLPEGIYLLKISTGNKDIAEQRALFFVSDVALLAEELPEKSMRYAVVSATTGQPLQNASLRLTFPDSHEKDSFSSSRKSSDVITLHCNDKGEVIYHFTRQNPEVDAYTPDDHYCPRMDIWGNYIYDDHDQEKNHIKLFTDRKIYRPGQTVSVAAIDYTLKNGIETKVVSGESIKLTLRNANDKVIGEKELTTDKYGTASTSFALPLGGLTGQFSVYSDNLHGETAVTSFNVEEYKRPTFQVLFPEVKQIYHAGDTVMVKAVAKGYTGVPVQGAKVRYKVIRRPVLWWRAFGMSESLREVYSDTTVTNDEGEFTVRIPMVVEGPEDGPARFYKFEVNADITDVGGETESGKLILPLGTHPAAFSCNLPDKAESDSLKTIVFQYRNAAGTDIPATVNYHFDEGPEQTANTNEKIKLQGVSDLASGTHTLWAICGTDTLKQKIVLFKMTDKTPAVSTHDWFYQSSKEFNKDGRPVYIQVGSSDPDQHILYTIFSGNKVLESGCINQSSTLHTRAFVNHPEYGDGIRLTYAWMKNGVVYMHSATIESPLPDKRLVLNWSSFRNLLTPGQKETWTLKVTYPDGSPASAQLLSVLYDGSLDQIMKHNWNFYLGLNRSLPVAFWQSARDNFPFVNVYGRESYKTYETRSLEFSAFNPIYFETGNSVNYSSLPQVRALGVSRYSASREMAYDNAPVALMSKQAVSVNGMNKSQETDGEGEAFSLHHNSASSFRENLNETAFFYPALTADSNGNIVIKFTLPESVTTWHFMAFAHDKDMNFGQLSDTLTARKTVMIQPNMPRFVREGDLVNITGRLSNTSSKMVTGIARIELLNPETEKIVYSESHCYTIRPEKTAVVGFYIDLTNHSDLSRKLAGFDHSLLICRMIAEGSGYSDGEQHYLPVLPNTEFVTNTLSFTQNKPGRKTIDLTTLFPANSINKKLTVEYTNHPSWLMIQSLPSIATPDHDNAVSLAAAYYANGIATYLMRQNPVLKNVLEIWKRDHSGESALMSQLDQNQDLKNLVLSETPWVLEADRQTDQKRKLCELFDENLIQSRQNETLIKLRQLQHPDGSWAWWPGMRGSIYMTEAVSEALVRLNVMTGNQQETVEMLKRAFNWMTGKLHDEVIRLKDDQRHGLKDVLPSEEALRFLYMDAIDGRSLPSKGETDKTYLVNLIADHGSAMTIYGKAKTAVILAKNNHVREAKEYLQSINEYSVYTDEAGRYFDTSKAQYSWCDYKIPTEVAAIEGLRILDPKSKAIDEMRRWLLQEKRTTSWDTPVNAVDAVYAFGIDSLTPARKEDSSVISLDGKKLATSQALAGLGYVKSSEVDSHPKILTVDKTDKGISWGAVYAQFMQKSADIQNFKSGMAITKEIISPSDSQIGDVSLQVGERVKVRLTITCDRDYDFVQVSDHRPACFEPVNQVSGYHGNYYYAPKDEATDYFFDGLSKGRHVLETEYVVDRTGSYQSGTCTVQCAYSPSYGARTTTQTYVVK